jgi:hypothetical protein
MTERSRLKPALLVGDKAQIQCQGWWPPLVTGPRPIDLRHCYMCAHHQQPLLPGKQSNHFCRRVPSANDCKHQSYKESTSATQRQQYHQPYAPTSLACLCKLLTACPAVHVQPARQRVYVQQTCIQLRITITFQSYWKTTWQQPQQGRRLLQMLPCSALM